MGIRNRKSKIEDENRNHITELFYQRRGVPMKNRDFSSSSF